MTLASLDHAIATAEREFACLNSGRWIYPRGKRTYRKRDAYSEKRLVELADRIARLHRFRSHLFAKQYALDLRD